MTLDEIKRLREYAIGVFGTEIPLSSEIGRIITFLEQMKSTPKMIPGLMRVIKSVKYSLQIPSLFYERPIEIDLPEETKNAILNEIEKLLYSKCDRLAELSQYQDKEE